MKKETLRILDQDGIRTISFHRPKSLNALNLQTLDELSDVMRETHSNSSIQVVILTGDGNKAFVAGANVKEMQDATANQARAFSQKGHDVLACMY